MTGVIGVRPTVLDTAQRRAVESLTWSRWGDDGAVGAGELRIRDCQPTCAQRPHARRSPATVTLTGVRECRGRRYFEGAEVARRPHAVGEQPATYVRAPC